MIIVVVVVILSVTILSVVKIRVLVSGLFVCSVNLHSKLLRRNDSCADADCAELDVM